MKLKNKTSIIIFIAPAIIIYSVFRLFPALASLYYGLTDWNGITKGFNFIGLNNFLEMTKDSLVLTSIKNTIIFTIVVTVIQNLLGILFALMVDNREIRGYNFFRTVLFVPAVISTAVIGFIWTIIMNPVLGTWTQFFNALNLGGVANLDPLGNSSIAIFAVAGVTIWQFTGYSMLIYLSGLQSIPDDLYESADIDGANRWKKFRHITLPMLAPTVTINIILSTIGCMKEFEHVYVLTNGGPGDASQVVGTAIYKVAFGVDGGIQRFGYGIALSTGLLLAVCIVSAVQMTILKKREVTM